MTPTLIEAVFVECCPFHGVDEPILDEEYAGLPIPFTNALFDLEELRDNAACWRCDAVVGFALVERGDAEHQEWQPTGLASEGDGPVAVLCGDCAPYVPTEPEGSR